MKMICKSCDACFSVDVVDAVLMLNVKRKVGIEGDGYVHISRIFWSKLDDVDGTGVDDVDDVTNDLSEKYKSQECVGDC